MYFFLSVHLDMMNIDLIHAKKAQGLATDTNYKTFLHKYTTLPTDMNIAWAKKAYGLQSEVSIIVKGITVNHAQIMTNSRQDFKM